LFGHPIDTFQVLTKLHAECFVSRRKKCARDNWCGMGEHATVKLAGIMYTIWALHPHPQQANIKSSQTVY
jgi:hypothetical protein